MRVPPKSRAGKDLKIGVDFSVTVESTNANDLQDWQAGPRRIRWSIGVNR
jgi:hypothetical protein